MNELGEAASQSRGRNVRKTVDKRDKTTGGGTVVEGCAWKIGQRGGKIEKRKEKREEKKAAERVKSPRVVRSKHHRAIWSEEGNAGFLPLEPVFPRGWKNMAAIKRARVSSLLTGDAVISKKEIFTIVFGEELCVFFLFTFFR